MRTAWERKWGGSRAQAVAHLVGKEEIGRRRQWQRRGKIYAAWWRLPFRVWGKRSGGDGSLYGGGARKRIPRESARFLVQIFGSVSSSFVARFEEGDDRRVPHVSDREKRLGCCWAIAAARAADRRWASAQWLGRLVRFFFFCSFLFLFSVFLNNF